MATAPDPRRLAAERRAEAARNARFVLNVDGDKYVFRLGDVTATDVRELRNQAGMSVPEMAAQTQDLASSFWDIDSAAALIWMARRQMGELTVPFREVADGLRMDQVIEIRHEDTPEDVEDYPDPPASGGSSDDASPS